MGKPPPKQNGATPAAPPVTGPLVATVACALCDRTMLFRTDGVVWCRPVCSECIEHARKGKAPAATP